MTTTNTDTPAVELTREWVEWLIASRGASPDEFNCKLIAMARSWLAWQGEPSVEDWRQAIDECWTDDPRDDWIDNIERRARNLAELAKGRNPA